MPICELASREEHSLRLTSLTRTCLMTVLLIAISGCGVAPTAHSTIRPTVRIISPVGGAKISTSSVTVRVAISHFTLAPGGIEPAGSGQVWIYANGRVESRLGSTTATLILAPGTYTLKAVLVTNGKPVASSAPVVVTIDNSAATLTASCATPPAPGSGLKAGTITLFCNGLPAGSAIGSLVTGPDGNLWFTVNPYSAGTAPSIGRITPSGVITLFSKGMPSGYSPGGLVAGPDGNLWLTFNQGCAVNGCSSGIIGRITPSGAITLFGKGLLSGSGVGGLVAGPDGNLWFTASLTNAIGRITPSGAITLFSKGPSGYSPGSLVAGPDGNLWFINRLCVESGCSLALGRITPSGAITLFSKGLPSGSYASGLVAGPDGNLWFADAVCPGGFSGGQCNSSSIGRIAPSGAITLFSKGLSSGSYASGLVVGPDGNLWFTEESCPGGGCNSSSIGRITPSGVITLFSHGLSAGWFFGNLTAGPDGNLWFTANGEIGRITPSGVITLFSKGLPASSSLYDLVVGPDGNLWFTDGGAIGWVFP